MEKPKFGIAVDGSCLGNPGVGEYRGIDIATGEELFRVKFLKTTNNVMEFCGLVHGLKYRKEKGLNSIIYSDSITALTWVEKWEINSSLTREGNDVHWQFINNCIRWLANNTKKGNISIQKWDTKNWGENPADFGRKNKNFFSKDELIQFIKEEESKPLVDLTTLARLKERFKI
jgi:ribonuclease HI